MIQNKTGTINKMRTKFENKLKKSNNKGWNKK
jgi:hypothetical protein